MPVSKMPHYDSGLQKLTPDLYTYLLYNGTWGLANTTFLVGKESVLLVDTLMYGSIIQPFLKKFRETTNKPVRYLVNTHSHGDHTNGNEDFKSSTIISHVNCFNEMKANKAAAEERARNPVARPAAPAPSWRTPQIAAELEKVNITFPNFMVNESATIHLDDTEVQLLHYGPGHTGGDLVVFFPKYGIVAVGDLGFFYCTPNLTPFGSVKNWIVITEKILALDADKYISGHGPIGGKAALKEQQEYLEFVFDAAKKGVKEGIKSSEAAKRLNLGAYAQWGEAERITGAMGTAYRDLGAVALVG